MSSCVLAHKVTDKSTDGTETEIQYQWALL